MQMSKADYIIYKYYNFEKKANLSKADYIMFKYYEGFEKDANWVKAIGTATKFIGNLGKNFKWGDKLLNFSDELATVSKNFTDTGLAKNYLSKYTTSFNVYKDPVTGQLKSLSRPENAGFIQNRIGDAVAYFSRLGEGISGKDGFFKGLTKGIRNFFKTEGALFRDATYKTVNRADPNGFSKYFGIKQNIVKGDDGAEYLVSNFPFARKRKILGYSEDGTEAIVKKRLPARAMAYTFTPLGMVGSGMLMGASPGESVKDALMWAPPFRTIGELSMLKDVKNLVT